VTVELAITPNARWEADTDALVVAAAEVGFVALGIGRQRAEASESLG
jgi:hypothetical protein